MTVGYGIAPVLIREGSDDSVFAARGLSIKEPCRAPTVDQADRSVTDGDGYILRLATTVGYGITAELNREVSDDSPAAAVGLPIRSRAGQSPWMRPTAPTRTVMATSSAR